MTDIVERLRNCQNDPMWADHAEISKATCKEAADTIEAQAAEIERLRANLTITKNFIGPYTQLPGHEHAALQALCALEEVEDDELRSTRKGKDKP